MPDQLSWDAYFLLMAHAAAMKSKDTTKVGAVLTTSDTRIIISVGYNGAPRSFSDDPAILARRASSDAELDKYAVSVHAEVNAILFAKRDVTGCTIYSTHRPCLECAKTICAAGIKRVVYDTATSTSMNLHAAKTDLLFRECGVTLEGVSRD